MSNRNSTLNALSGRTRNMDLGGQVITLAPLSMSAWAEFEQWVKDRPIADAKKKCEDFPESFHERIWEAALERSQNITMGSKEFNEEMETLSGLNYLLWLCVREKHKVVTIEEVDGWLSMGNIEEFQDHIIWVNGMDAETVNEKKLMAAKKAEKLLTKQREELVAEMTGNESSPGSSTDTE